MNSISVDTTFTLSVLSNLLHTARPPGGAFNETADWEQSYAVVTVGQRSSARVGRLRVQRRDGGRLLKVDYEVTGPGNTVHRERSEIHRKPGLWGDPERWQVRWGTYAKEGRPVPDTCWSTSATAGGKEIRFTDPVGERRLSAPLRFTLQWLLFDIVQQLPQQAFPPRRIALLDATGGGTSELTLAYRKTVTVGLGGKSVVKQEWRQLNRGRVRHTFRSREGERRTLLSAYSLVGPGTVPWMFWVDADRRLRIATRGLEAFLLEPANDKDRRK